MWLQQCLVIFQVRLGLGSGWQRPDLEKRRSGALVGERLMEKSLTGVKKFVKGQLVVAPYLLRWLILGQLVYPGC